MTLSELIKKLEEIKEKYGDLLIKYYPNEPDPRLVDIDYEELFHIISHNKAYGKEETVLLVNI